MPVEKLCRELTGLSDNDIKCIESMANVLQPIANMEAADVFIDCMATNGEALVVAEAKPEGSISSYKDSVVGMMAEERNEPAVARTLRLGIPTRQMKAFTQEGRCVIQSVEPIFNERSVIGVLIREQRTDHLEDIESDAFSFFKDPILNVAENTESNW